MTDISLIRDIIVSACVLHNFILDEEGDLLEVDYDYEESDNDDTDEEVFDDEHMQEDALAKRDRIANTL